MEAYMKNRSGTRVWLGVEEEMCCAWQQGVPLTDDESPLSPMPRNTASAHPSVHLQGPLSWRVARPVLG